MSVPFALLGLLEREPSHGYDLKRDYDSFFGRGKSLPFGQVYSTLSRLVRDDLLAGLSGRERRHGSYQRTDVAARHNVGLPDEVGASTDSRR